MGHIQIRVESTSVVADTEVLVFWREAVQEILRYQPVEIFETWNDKGILVLRGWRARAKVAAGVVVRNSAEHHNRLQEQDERVGVLRGMLCEDMFRR